MKEKGEALFSIRVNTAASVFSKSKGENQCEDLMPGIGCRKRGYWPIDARMMKSVLFLSVWSTCDNHNTKGLDETAA